MAVRCPICQAEIPQGKPTCQLCEGAAAVEQDLGSLWSKTQARPASEVFTSAKRTVDVAKAEARAARKRAMTARRAERPPSVPPSGPPRRDVEKETQRPPPPPLQSSLSPRGEGPRLAGAAAPVKQAGAAEEPLPGKPGRTFGPQAQIATKIATEDPQIDRGTQIVDVSVPAFVKRARKVAEEEKSAGPDESFLAVEESLVSRGVDATLASVTHAYTRLHPTDRRTVWAALVGLLCSFLPWSYVRGEGLLAGVQELGLLTAVASGLVLVSVYARTVRRRLIRGLLALQLLLAAALVAVPVYRHVTAGEAELSYGVYLTALGGLTMVLFSLERLGRQGS